MAQCLVKQKGAALTAAGDGGREKEACFLRDRATKSGHKMYNWLDAQEGRGEDERRSEEGAGFLDVGCTRGTNTVPLFGDGVVETELQIRENLQSVQSHSSLPGAICLVVATDIFAPSAKNNCEFFAARSGVTVASAAAK